MKNNSKQIPKRKGNTILNSPVNTEIRASQAKPEKESGGWLSFVFKPFNLLFALIAILFLAWCNTSVPSYNWVYQGLLKGGYEYCGMVQKEIDRRVIQTKDPALRKKIAYDTKYEAKIGINYIFLNYIKDRTPDNAIILFPPNEILSKETSYLTLKPEVRSKTWVTHFLYPRTVVYESEKGKNPFYGKAQYIVLLHGWGFDHLDYSPAQRNSVDVVPIHKLN